MIFGAHQGARTRTAAARRPKKFFACEQQACAKPAFPPQRSPPSATLRRKQSTASVPTLEDAHKMSDQELVERLISVRGIGAWTVEMFLIFRLGRPDVLPIHDYGVQKGFAITYRKKSHSQAERAGQIWRALAALSHRRQLVPVARRRTRRQRCAQNLKQTHRRKFKITGKRLVTRKKRTTGRNIA